MFWSRFCNYYYFHATIRGAIILDSPKISLRMGILEWADPLYDIHLNAHNIFELNINLSTRFVYNSGPEVTTTFIKTFINVLK